MFQVDWERHETSSDVQVITYFFWFIQACRMAWMFVIYGSNACIWIQSLSTSLFWLIDAFFSPPFSTNEENCNVSFGTALSFLLFEHLMMFFSCSKLAISNLSSTKPPGPSSSAAVDARSSQSANFGCLSWMCSSAYQIMTILSVTSRFSSTTSKSPECLIALRQCQASL